jgi:DNA-binding NarL/FixJ family response regulator
MSLRILIVEDSATDRQLLRYVLEEQFRNEAKFREADTLAGAFKYLESGNKFDCVVLDLQLPDSAGRETFEKLNARFPDIPYIVMTHNKNRDLAIEMIQAGAADYVLKDFNNADDIYRRIRFAVEKHRHTVRVAPEKANTVHQLERAKANMLTAHKSGEHVAIQSTTIEMTSAVADLSRKMFTELQALSSQLAQKQARDEQMAKTVETLEAEILKGTGGRHSMRSQVDILDHRLGTVEKRFSDFKELTEKKIEATEDKAERRIGEIRTSAVHVQTTHMTNRTKILLGILALLGGLASAIGTYEASTHSSTPTAPTGR